MGKNMEASCGGKTSRCEIRCFAELEFLMEAGSSSSGTSHLWGKDSSTSVYFQHIPCAFLKIVERRVCSHNDKWVGDTQAPAMNLPHRSTYDQHGS